MGQEKDDEKVFRVDTVPPPAGESDAYNAPTRVGPVTSEAWAELIKQANEEGKAKAQGAAEAKNETSTTSTAPKPVVPRPTTSRTPPKEDGALPRTYDEKEEDDEAATLLHPKARPTDAPPPSAAPVLPPPPPPSANPPPALVASAPPAPVPSSEPVAPARRTMSMALAWTLVILFLSIAAAGFAVWATLGH